MRKVKSLLFKPSVINCSYHVGRRSYASVRDLAAINFADKPYLKLLQKQGADDCVQVVSSFMQDARLSNLIVSLDKPTPKIQLKKIRQTAPDISELVKLLNQRERVMVIAKGAALPGSRFENYSHHAVVVTDHIEVGNKCYVVVFDPEAIASTENLQILDALARLKGVDDLTNVDQNTLAELNRVRPLIRIEEAVPFLNGLNTGATHIDYPHIDNQEEAEEHAAQHMGLMGIYIDN